MLEALPGLLSTGAVANSLWAVSVPTAWAAGFTTSHGLGR